jgi:hypothetical protein
MLLMIALPSRRFVVGGADVAGVVERLRRLRQAEPNMRLQQANCSRRRKHTFRRTEIGFGARGKTLGYAMRGVRFQASQRIIFGNRSKNLP